MMENETVRRAAVVGCLCLAILGGCSRQQVDQVQGAIASSAPGLANDGAIYAAIEGKLVSIDADSALHVAISSHDGFVRMSGRVKSDETEKKFVEAAARTNGVMHVNATMTVDTKLPSATKEAQDFALAAVVRAALTAQAGINGVGLGIVAKDGTVTLTGDVATRALHSTIVSTVHKTAGVTSVVDRLHVQS